MTPSHLSPELRPQILEDLQRGDLLRFLPFVLDTRAGLPEKAEAGDTYCEYGPGILCFIENWEWGQPYRIGF